MGSVREIREQIDSEMAIYKRGWDDAIKFDALRKRVEQFVAHYRQNGAQRLGNGEALQFFADAQKLLEE